MRTDPSSVTALVVEAPAIATTGTKRAGAVFAGEVFRIDSEGSQNRFPATAGPFLQRARHDAALRYHAICFDLTQDSVAAVGVLVGWSFQAHGGNDPNRILYCCAAQPAL
jgi:hypothetical protein